MRVTGKLRELERLVDAWKRRGETIGFVPTMGSLHEGHLSLVRHAKKENRKTVVSLFVNPLQFGPDEDYARYPRDPARDRALLKKEKADLVYAPSVKDFYPPGFQTAVAVKELSRSLCGARRPVHFAGVATVVLKLLNAVRPDAVYLGQKDYQQFRVVERMVRDLGVPVSVKMAPIVREKDGLAMSSRNIFLSPAERRQAPHLHRALEKGRALIESGVKNACDARKAALRILSRASGARLDYLEIVDAVTLRPVVKLTEGARILIAAAVFFGKTRLIDNVLAEVKK
ncbi:MAG: pantoate--beta-alanine ligase [Candidatus Omnitrophica bacterium]|nr:pantoate--beta-alanine ligase [Candidatus Omnitrophota bacterium]